MDSLTLNARLRAWTVDHWPLLVASLLYLSAVAWLVIGIFRVTRGHFSYTLDDGYIHMSVARRIVEDQTWGVDGQRWSGTASSLAWPPMLALLYIFGPWHFAPLVLNVLFGLLALER